MSSVFSALPSIFLPCHACLAEPKITLKIEEKSLAEPKKTLSIEENAWQSRNVLSREEKKTAWQSSNVHISGVLYLLATMLLFKAWSSNAAASRILHVLVLQYEEARMVVDGKAYRLQSSDGEVGY